MNISARIRPGIEASPWVCEEVARLEARVVELEKELATWQAMGKALHELGLRQIKLPEVHYDIKEGV
jgi:hypothetical protein